MQMKGPGTIAAGAAAALVVATGALLPRAHAHNPLDTVHLPDVDSQELTWQHSRSLSRSILPPDLLPETEDPTGPTKRGFRPSPRTPEEPEASEPGASLRTDRM